MGIDECLVAGSEESQDRVEEEQTDDAQSDTDDEIQRNRVAQNVLRCGIILLSQLHADGCGRSYANTGSESGGEVHEGEGDGETRDGHGSHTLTDEYAVNNVVERRGGHRNHRWQGILNQQLAHRLRT